MPLFDCSKTCLYIRQAPHIWYQTAYHHGKQTQGDFLASLSYIRILSRLTTPVSRGQLSKHARVVGNFSSDTLVHGDDFV